MQKKNIASKLFTLFFTIVLVICLKEIYGIYRENNFKDFIRAECFAGLSEFKRDSNVRYSKLDSYCITSYDYNDAMFHKSIEVIPNTPYRVTCMIKTQEIEAENNISMAGAGICIYNTTETSPTISGTSDGWQKVELLFDSKNRTQIDIGFRLGSYLDNCKGTAWFSDFKLEAGIRDALDTNWKMACFVVNNLDVNLQIDGRIEHVVEKLSREDIENIRANMDRTKKSMYDLSGQLMKMEYDIIEIKEPVTNVTYSSDNGYYLSTADMAEFIKPYIVDGEYDYIYVVARFGNVMHNDIENKIDWFGLRRNGLFGHRLCQYTFTQ